MTSETVIIVIDEGLYRDCEDALDQWRKHVESHRSCRVADTLIVPKGTPRSHLRSQIIRMSRQFDAAGDKLNGVQIFGVDVDTFWFVVGGYSFQTDAVYGNWPITGRSDTTWEDQNLDKSLSEDEFPTHYCQSAWVGRWGGMNTEGEPESELFRRFVERSADRLPWYDLDAAIVYLDSDKKFATYGGACENIRLSFPVVLEYHGHTVLPFLVTSPGLFNQKRSRYLALFGHGGPDWMADLTSDIVYRGFGERAGPDIVALNGCVCGLWRSQSTALAMKENIVFNLLNPAVGGPIAVFAYATSPGFYVEANYGAVPSLSRCLSAESRMGSGWLGWVNGIVSHLQSEDRIKDAIAALTYGIYGDASWCLWS